MHGFPVYSYGQRTISLWFNNSVQEGDGPILLVVLYCEPYGRVNTVYVLEEALFISFLVDDKVSLNKFNILVTKKEGNIMKANAVNLTRSSSVSQPVRQASTPPLGKVITHPKLTLR